MNHIVVGVDGSAASVAAARRAGRIATATGAKVTAVHVGHLPVPPTDPALDPAAVEAVFQAADRQAEARAAEALDPLGVAWVFQRRVGDPAEQLQLTGAELTADLVVVGARDHWVAERLLLGSVATRLLHRASRSVLLVRGVADGEPTLSHLVVGADGSAASAKAVSVAGELARDVGAALTVVCVRCIPPGYLGAPVFTPGQLEDVYERLTRRAAATADQALTRLGVAWTWMVRTGEPAEELELAGEELGADLVAVGSRGLGAAGRVLLGSVSTRLAHHCSRSLLVVR